MSEKVWRIGVAGLGTVGGGLLQFLDERPDFAPGGAKAVVTGVSARYRRPARYGDTVQVTCWGEHLGSRGIHFAYEVHKNGELLVTGNSEHLWIDKATGRPCRMPEAFRESFERLAGKSA